MSRRTVFVLLPILALTLVGATASVVGPDRGLAALTGVRSVSQAENDAATKYWNVRRTTSAAPSPGPTLPASTTAPTTTVAAPAPPPTQTSGTPSDGIPAVGALFSVDSDGLAGHFCTASVVNSPEGDLVLTAAHCIHDGAGGDYRSDIVFVPGYHDGQEPYGVWTPSQLVVDPRWISDSDPDLDFGFLVVHKQNSDQRIQDATGANQLGVGQGFDLPVRVTGYPVDGEEPVTCSTTSQQAQTYQMQFTCGGFSTGTSGGPWVTGIDPNTQLGTVVGVIGGYEGGGDSDDVSYSSYFDEDIQNLYNTAASLS